MALNPRFLFSQEGYSSEQLFPAEPRLIGIICPHGRGKNKLDTNNTLTLIRLSCNGEIQILSLPEQSLIFKSTGNLFLEGQMQENDRVDVWIGQISHYVRNGLFCMWQQGELCYWGNSFSIKGELIFNPLIRWLLSKTIITSALGNLILPSLPRQIYLFNFNYSQW